VYFIIVVSGVNIYTFKMTGGDKLKRVWIGAVTAQLKCCRVKYPAFLFMCSL